MKKTILTTLIIASFPLIAGTDRFDIRVKTEHPSHDRIVCQQTCSGSPLGSPRFKECVQSCRSTKIIESLQQRRHNAEQSCRSQLPRENNTQAVTSCIQAHLARQKKLRGESDR